MIYNLVQYLRTQFPAETFYPNERPPEVAGIIIPDRNTLIKETGGPIQAWTGYTEGSFQVLSRDLDPPHARELAYLVFDEINVGRFGLPLPVVTVNGIVYNEITSAQITAIQRPQSIGADEEGRSIFSTNYKVIYIIS